MERILASDFVLATAVVETLVMVAFATVYLSLTAAWVWLLAWAFARLILGPATLLG